MLYILMAIFEALLFSFQKSDIPKFKTEEERLAYIKELESSNRQNIMTEKTMAQATSYSNTKRLLKGHARC